MTTELEKEVLQKFEAKLLQIVRRYQEDVSSFDMSASVFNDCLDSLDLAEVFSWVEQQFGVSPMEQGNLNFKNWEDVAQWVANRLNESPSSH